MELGALVVTQGLTLHSSARLQTSEWCSAWPVVGKTVVERWVDRVREMGVGMVSVVDRDVSVPHRIQQMVEWAKDGVEQILVIFMGSYAEIDLPDLLQFHHQGGHQITRVFDPHGPLGVSLLDRRAVIKTTPTVGEPTRSSRYDFSGYVTRLSSTHAYRQLVQDALKGRCNLRPTGTQTCDGIWVDPTASVHPSVKIQAPCYIGAHSKLNAGVTIAGYSSVEENCEIDMGTTLECASVLPNTYLAAGLHVRNAVVDGTCLEHLESGVTVDLEPVALSARRPLIRRETRA